MAQIDKKNRTRITSGSKPLPAAAKTSRTKSTSEIVREEKGSQAFGRRNFIAMGIAGALIVIGFLLMLGPSSTQETFEPDIFSSRRIVVGPTLAFLGFLTMAIAIIISPTKSAPAAEAVAAPGSDEQTRIVTNETK